MAESHSRSSCQHSKTVSCVQLFEPLAHAEDRCSRIWLHRCETFNIVLSTKEIYKKPLQKFQSLVLASR